MNPIDKAIQDTIARIPQAILNETFLKRRGFTGIMQYTPVSLDHRIREEVIEARVIPDCNLVGGTEETVSLQGLQPDYLPDYKVVWRIPLSRTNNRRITRVYSLIFGEGGAPTNASLYTQGQSIIQEAAQGLMDAHMPIPQVSNADVSLIGENTVMARMHFPYSPNLYVRVQLEADSEFSHLRPGSIPAFTKLVEYATKAYIYNTLILELDQGMISGGYSLGRFMSIVEDYADAEELYQEYYQEKWRKIAIFSDDQAYKRHLKRLVSRQ